MDNLLKHLLDVTGHRDHQLLELSILSTLYKTTLARKARLFRIFFSNGRLVAQPQAWVLEGVAGVADDSCHSVIDETPLSDYPILECCVNQAVGYMLEVMPDGSHKLWYPIMMDGKVSACFEVHKSDEFFPSLLDRIDVAMGIYSNYACLLDYSQRDSLTGLLNRKTFEGHFGKRKSANVMEVPRTPDQPSRRTPAASDQRWLAVVDIDHFKRVNDVFGHLYGDEVLILVAQLMQASFRNVDRVFRFGGEEFTILIYSSSFENASAAIERFRCAVERHRFPQVGKITVSVGFTSFTPEDSPVVVLGHADQALYYAKEHGRNQVCHYESLVEAGLLPKEEEIETASIEFF